MGTYRTIVTVLLPRFASSTCTSSFSGLAISVWRLLSTAPLAVRCRSFLVIAFSLFGDASFRFDGTPKLVDVARAGWSFRRSVKMPSDDIEAVAFGLMVKPLVFFLGGGLEPRLSDEEHKCIWWRVNAACCDWNADVVTNRSTNKMTQRSQAFSIRDSEPFMFMDAMNTILLSVYLPKQVVIRRERVGEWDVE